MIKLNFTSLVVSGIKESMEKCAIRNQILRSILVRTEVLLVRKTGMLFTLKNT